MTNKDILKVYSGIQELIDSKVPLNIKTGYLLAKNKRLLEPFAEAVEEQQLKLYKKYGHEEKDGIKVENKDVPALQRELKELFDIENIINISKIPIQNFEDNTVDVGILEKLIPILEE